MKAPQRGWWRLLLAVAVTLPLRWQADSQQVPAPVCTAGLRPFLNETHKDVYRIGVLAIRGFDAAYTEFNKTFSDYLTATAGQRFDKPIRFELKPLNFLLLFSDVEDASRTSGVEGVDFIYVNPSAFSCIESQYGANTLVSQISRRVVGGQEYHLTRFGGVIFTRADNNQINSIEDIRDQRVACASISGLGSGQMQFRLLQQRGLSYIQDPKQLVFTSNQGKVVNGVLQGQFDVGFVRTDQIERTIDATTGQLVNRSSLKIIEGRFEDFDGAKFPFESSTILYPEWNVASLQHVSDDIAVEVQNAMLALEQYADVGLEVERCVAANCANITNAAAEQQCRASCFPSTLTNCATTPELAALALEAKTQGRYTGFRSTLSYMELRNMQQETNFIRQEADGTFGCIRSSRIYDAIVCPPGHFLRPEAEVERGCTDIGLECGKDFQCICKPCVRGFDVDIVPKDVDNRNEALSGACPKFAICGTVEQSKSITFLAQDNKKRSGLQLSATILEGSFAENLTVTPVFGSNHSYEFVFQATNIRTGTIIFEVSIGEEQIPESPFRLFVEKRRCGEETGDQLKEADDLGNCVCKAGASNAFGTCVSNTTLISSTVVPALLILAASIYIYLNHKRKQADSVWLVKPEELHFDDPPAILGRGTFGLVLQAEYRGTAVAVKRVIPPKVKRSKRSNGGSSSWRNSLLGMGAVDTNQSAESSGTDHKMIEQARVRDNPMSSDLEQDSNIDAMESGRHNLDLNPRVSDLTVKVENASDTRHAQKHKRRIHQHGEHSAGENRDHYFDFSNLDKFESRLRSRQAPIINNNFDGMQSGGMQSLMEPTPRMRVSRRHSMGSNISSGFVTGVPPTQPSGYGGGYTSGYGVVLGGGYDPISKRHSETDAARQMRRGSWGPSGDSSSDLKTVGTLTVNESSWQPPASADLRPNRQFRRHSFGGGVVPQQQMYYAPPVNHTRHTPSTQTPYGTVSAPQYGSAATTDDAPASSGQQLPAPTSVRMLESDYLNKQETTEDTHATSNGRPARTSFSAASSFESIDKMAEAMGTTSSPISGTVSFLPSIRGRSSSGSFGRKLRKAKEQIFGSGDEYARLKADFIHEMRHLSKLRHPCITTVMGAVISRKSEPMLVMEFMDHGSLYDLLHNESVVVDGQLVLPILRDIAQGVRFLHAARPQVIHGDLKAQNVLVDSKFRAKVADFGLSQKKRVGATGTPFWMAPELLRGESDNTDASDVYSFGILLYEVYSRQDPYEGENHMEVLRAVADPAVNRRPAVPSNCPPIVASIMTDCLVADPERRPSFEELDLRLRRLDVENVEPGTTPFSRKRDIMAARNQNLLFEVFPRHVAEALRDGRRVEAESFECVTIFFSDIVGYTNISANLTPRKVSDLLDRLYRQFDNLSAHYGVFKIETIGDAYMAVTNLTSEQHDHVARVARFAIAAVEAAQTTMVDVDEPEKGYVNIRVGFHSGPIVADVVGSRCPKYALFGDTVNTASRMESNSLPGRIQCSDRSAEMLLAQGPEVPIVARGKIMIKGKGEMFTYWVNETDMDEANQQANSSLPPSRTLDAIKEDTC